MLNLPENEKQILNEMFAEGEKFPVEVEEDPRIDRQIEPLVQRLEKDISLSKPINDRFGQPLVSPPSSQNPKIILPISQNTYNLGLTKKVSESIRWLAEWCFRLIKIFGGKASFRKAVIK